jgi:hypothetical protein
MVANKFWGGKKVEKLSEKIRLKARALKNEKKIRKIGNFVARKNYENY